MTTTAAGDGPLTPYRVLDLTGELGALCGRLMAGIGADVIRVEPPGGHPHRRRAPFYHGVPDPERSLHWFQMNLGKRSVTLNLEKADGRALFRRLVATADFMVESLPVGEMARLGLGYEALAGINPRLVLTSISVFGQTGPLAHADGGDIIGVAAGGLMYLCGDQDRPPVRVTAEQGSAQAGIHAAAASMVAHWARERTGRGTHVDVSMQEAMLWTLANNRLLWPAAGIIPHRAGGGRAGAAGSRLIYAAADGYLGFMRRPEHHANLQRWLDDAGIDPGFRIDEWQGRPLFGEGGPPPEQVIALEAALSDYFAQQPKGELYREGQARGLVLAEVSTPQDLIESEHLRVRVFWQQVPHPELDDTLTYPGAPFRMSETPWRVERRPPLLGEHNVEVYCDELGLSRAQLAMLKAAGAV